MFTFVEENAKAPDVACSENTVLMAMASTASPESDIWAWTTDTQVITQIDILEIQIDKLKGKQCDKVCP